MEETNLQQKREEQKIEKPKKPSIFDRLKNKLSNYKRVVSVSQKPTKEEFLSSAKITGVGILLLGVTGFIIFLIYFLVVK